MSKMGEKNPMFGHVYTLEEKKQMSQRNWERYRDPVEREKTGEAMRKYYQTPGAKEKQRRVIIKSLGKQVKCLETGQVFDCIMDAMRWCGLKNSTGISSCCKGKNKSAGKHPDTGVRLHWEYVN